MELSGKHVAVVGLGASGVAAAQLCLRQGASVTALDEAAPERLSSGAQDLADAGAQLQCGPLDEAVLLAADVIVVSPGVPPREAIAAAEAAGRAVIGELELASHFLQAPIALVGGTNGKSTVTAWLSEMLRASGQAVFTGGNYGTPLSAAVGEAHDVLVVEISSFQAERVPTLHAKACALLNISEDHLDRYADYAAYAHAKGNPFARMTAADVAVIPSGDEACARQVRRGGAQAVTFDRSDPAAAIHATDDAIVDKRDGYRYAVAGLKVRGTHNLANACAAIAMARPLGASHAGIEQALQSFAGLPHRHEWIADIAGVRYYDDSKATNVGAAVAALAGMDEEKAVLIAGGRDKQGAFEPLVEALRKRGRALILLGEAAARLQEAAAGALPIERVESLEQAVTAAANWAQAGDAVLLSPACSSYDMFANYKVRGQAFAAAVRKLEGAA